LWTLFTAIAVKDVQKMSRRAWDLARDQHLVIAREQMLELGFSSHAIAHRVASGRLRPLWPGIYAVGPADVTQHGWWMGAVLACGPMAALSHSSAAALHGIRASRGGSIEVVVPAARRPRVEGIRIHRSMHLEGDVTRHIRIPVTTPARTLIDLCTQLSPPQIERTVNEADRLDLIDPEALRAELERRKGQRGVRALREVLDRATFALTDSELERRFLPIAERAGLPLPLTQQQVNGFRVDFFWPELGLVVETDGLRYHRTPTQQKSDRVRDQVHAAAGLTTLRFTHAQVAFEAARVEDVLRKVAARLSPTQPRL
jgi:Protein of unknown function (DUF559)/AbiEi antitoxin C-terminal domain